MEKEEVKKYLFWGIIVGIIIISYFILKDFIVAILSAFVLAYLIRPLYLRLTKLMPEKLAALLTVLISLIIIGFVIVVVFTSLLNQLIKVAGQNTTEQVLDYFSNTKYYNVISDNISDILSNIRVYLINLFSSTISKAPSLILNIFITFFTTYYLLIGWDRIREKIIRIIPFENKKEIVEKIEKNAWEILMGSIIIAILEAIVAMIGFWILGINIFIVLGFIIGVLALIPALGPALIWVPLAIIMFLSKEYVTFAGIVILGIILSAGIDYLLRIKFLGSRTGMHPVIMLFGLLGGIKLFGIMGFVIGPLILSILITIIENIPNSSNNSKKK